MQRTLQTTRAFDDAKDMGNDRFLFLVSTSPGLGGKEQDEKDMRARAHAARRSHATRRAEPLTPTGAVDLKGDIPNPHSVSAFASANSHQSSIAKQQRQFRVSAAPRRSPWQANRPVRLWTRTAVDNGNDEPFNQMSVPDVPRYVISVLHEASRLKWTRIRPGALVTAVNPVARAWMEAALESPIALHGLVYAMLRTMLITRHNSGPETILALEHYAQCLAQLKDEMKRIQEGVTEASDNVIIAIAALAAHGESHMGMEKSSLETMPLVPLSPLSESQNLHVYGTGALQPAHVHAVYSLVSRKGGLQNISLEGLPDVLEVVDLCFATREGTRPQFGWRHSTSRSDLALDLKIDNTAEALFQKLGTGFPRIDALKPIHQLVWCTRVAIVMLDQHFRNGDPPGSKPELLNARNTVQYHLLCLPVANLTVSAGYETLLYEVCRLGLLIISNMILFPLPPESGVAHRLAKQLRNCLIVADHASDGNIIFSKYHDLLVWAVVLGAMSSTSLSDRTWFVNRLTVMLVPLVDHHWEEIEEKILYKYLWWQYVCSQPGQRIWEESLLIHCDEISDVV
ncbi:hypothetical protein PV08_08327 [Exophiala spinifera]|uniref:Transcription factor domain-containing protein n=1 Tax=Exophiala spinifera TaxID=91928 RepID=A0A0D2B3D3_9EURO|nr:uncharacterized protein PV08_08327 [Exophiala spinifera]KIW13140.1 hypothetical protein PV08_08327 [Exophiala spinifera]